MARPSDYDLPHDEFRPGQFEAIDLIRKSKARIFLLAAPTGSGKSAIAGGLVTKEDGGILRVLTKTRALQAQYETYDARALYGVRNYPCALFPTFMADQCAFPDSMFNCPEAANCHYLIERAKTASHYRQALSYAYWCMASWPRETPAKVLFCDEAHELPAAVMDHDSLTLTREEVVKRYDLPLWPEKKFKTLWRAVDIPTWIQECQRTLNKRIKDLNDKADATKKEHQRLIYVRKAGKLSTLLGKLSNCLQAMRQLKDLYYMHATDEELIMKPLVAKHSFWRAFMPLTQDSKIVMASATLSPHVFAELLGIPKSMYDSHVMPSNFPPESMPIYVPKKSPQMSHKLGDSGIRLQANLITKIIKECPKEWNGIIHTASKRHADTLAALLKTRFGNRVWIPTPGIGTEKRLQEWIDKLKEIPNLICIAYTFFEGVDAGFAKFCILAKIPFATLDDFGQEQLRVNPHMYKMNAALLVQQAMGRIRRGEPEHYEVENEPVRKLSFIVDRNVWKLRQYYPEHFLNCLTSI